MKLIKPSHQIIEPTGYTVDDIYKSIELAGRVSHKSEDRITEDSATTFVERMIKLGHGAVLEHGTVYLRYDFKAKEDSNRIAFRLWSKYNENKYSESVQAQPIPGVPNGFVAITTNYRVLVENNWLDDLKYLCEPTEYHKKRYTVKFICDRGILAEFTRHRKFSFMAESTRYCNYSKGKFNNELTFIHPLWMYHQESGDYGDLGNLKNKNHGNKDGTFFEFIKALQYAEYYYFILLKEGWKPEQARNVLPLSLKTELYMCGFAEDWEKFFELRCAANAHPQARELAIPLREEFTKRKFL